MHSSSDNWVPTRDATRGVPPASSMACAASAYGWPTTAGTAAAVAAPPMANMPPATIAPAQRPHCFIDPALRNIGDSGRKPTGEQRTSQREQGVVLRQRQQRCRLVNSLQTAC